MRAFITGATGYIGGTIAAKLVEKGWSVTGLTRSGKSGEALKARGIEPIVGSLTDEAAITKASKEADLVINAADSDHAFVVSTIVNALEGSGKKFIHTSGSSVVADRAAGGPSSLTYHEEFLPIPVLEKRARIEIDHYVQASAAKGIHSIVICPTMIYGRGLGVNEESQQVPFLIELAKEKGVGLHVGAGENIWSNVHVLDLADLYLLAIEKAPAGSFFFAENGEASLKNVVQSLSKILGFGGKTENFPIDQAVLRWGTDGAYFGLGSNSRVSSEKARKFLGWTPRYTSIIDEIESGHYLTLHGK